MKFDIGTVVKVKDSEDIGIINYIDHVLNMIQVYFSYKDMGFTHFIKPEYLEILYQSNICRYNCFYCGRKLKTQKVKDINLYYCPNCLI